MQQLGAMGSILYNGSLSVYYLAVVTFNMKEKDIARKVEPWLHLISNGFSVGSAISLAVKQEYGPIPNQVKCWIATYPTFCGKDNPDECIRGSSFTRFYANWLALFPSIVTYVIACVVTILMLYSIVKQQRKADRWRLREQEESKNCTEKICACFYWGCQKKNNENENEIEKKSASSTPKLTMTPSKASKFAKMAKSLEHTSSPKSAMYSSDAGLSSRSGTKEGMTSILILKFCILME